MRINYLYVLLAYLVAVMFGSVYPSFSVHSYDKALHLMEFFVFAVLLLKTLEQFRIRNPELIVIIISLPLLYFTEWVQLFISSRTFSYADMVVDFAGVALAIGAKWVFTKL